MPQDFVPARFPAASERYDSHNESVFRHDLDRTVQDLARLVSDAVAAGGGGGGGGGGRVPMAESGRWTIPGLYGVDGRDSTALGMGLDIIKAYPFVPANTVSIDEIAVEVTLAQASTNVDVGVYDNGGGDLYPGTLLVSTGSVSVASTGMKKTAVTATELTAGSIYWLAIGRFDGGTNPNFSGWTTGATTNMPSIGVSDGALTSFTVIPDVQLRIDEAGPNLPATFGTTNLTYLNNHRTGIALRTV